MATIAIVKVAGQDEFNRLSRRLKEAGRGDLRRRMIREIRKAGDPALQATKAAWMGVEVTSTQGGGSSSGLRGRVAAATRISVLGSGIRIRVEPGQVDPTYGKALSYGLDGLGRWRHPVFGNRENWTQQAGQEVFYKTLERFEPRWRAGIEKAMDETAALIEG